MTKAVTNTSTGVLLTKNTECLLIIRVLNLFAGMSLHTDLAIVLVVTSGIKCLTASREQTNEIGVGLGVELGLGLGSRLGLGVGLGVGLGWGGDGDGVGTGMGWEMMGWEGMGWGWGWGWGGGANPLLWCRICMSVLLNAGRGIGTENCGLDNAFTSDGHWFCSDTELCWWI